MKKLCSLIFIGLILPVFALANVAFVSTNPMGNTGTLPLSVAQTAGAGTNTLNTACFVWDDLTGTSDINTATYNGVTMTAAGAKGTGGATGHSASRLFYVLGQPSGSHTLTASFTGTASEIYYELSTWQGVDQTTPVRPGTYSNSVNAVVIAGGNTTVITSNVTDLTTSCVNGGTSTNITPSQTLLGSNGGGIESGAADRATTAAASVSHKWSGGAAGSNFSFSGFSIQSVQAVTPSTSFTPRLIASGSLQLSGRLIIN